MKITINQKELNKAINIVQKVVTTRTTLPILSGILIEASDNRLNFTATDLELGINTYVECHVIEKGSIVVNSRLLGDFVRKLPLNSLINIKTTENNNMEIKCLNTEINILGNSSKEFPNNTFENDGIKLSIKSDILKNLIKYTSFAATQDNINPIFNGCLFELKDELCYLVALDGFRMAVKSEKINYKNEIKTIIPLKTLNEVNRILEDFNSDIEIILSESHISFNIGKTTIISNLLEGKFIDYKSLIKNGCKTITKINTNELKNSIERASLLAREEKNNLIIFDIKENIIKLYSNSDYGNVEEFIVLERKEGEDIKIGFNSKYIIDVLRVIESEQVEMRILGSINPCFITEVNNDSYNYMILPVRFSMP